MKLTNRDLGKLGEDYAANWLTSQGYQILDRNWRGTRVELDIIARRSDCLVFCEVKTRRSVNCGYPAEAVTQTKLRNINTAALQWLQAKDIRIGGIRIDVLALNFDGETFEVVHLKDVGSWI